MSAAIWVFGLAFMELAYVYIGYPIILWALARTSGRDHLAGTALPDVTILVAAHQEAVVIRDKLENFIAIDYPAERLRMLIVSDGSTDGTDETIEAYDCPRIQLLRQEPRQGKAAALGLGLESVDAGVVVFTDANVMFEPNAVARLVRHFEDPAVGAVTGTVELADRKLGYSESEGAYYRYERFLQITESRYASVVGVDSALYAARRELVEAPPSTAILDDFVLSMEIAARGHRIIYKPGATAYEDGAPALADEFRRKTRVAIGAFQSMASGWGVPGVRTPRLLFCYLSHKVLRWVGPVFLVALLAANAIAALARLPQLTHDCDDFSNFGSRNSLILLSPIFVTPV